MLSRKLSYSSYLANVSLTDINGEIRFYLSIKILLACRIDLNLYFTTIYKNILERSQI